MGIKKKKVYKNEGIYDTGHASPEAQEPVVNVTMDQKKMSLSGNEDHVEAAITILRESFGNQKLVGKSEYETVVNAIRFDVQADVIINFINAIDSIKNGSLHERKTNV